jgi:hypothetical protein
MSNTWTQLEICVQYCEILFGLSLGFLQFCGAQQEGALQPYALYMTWMSGGTNCMYQLSTNLHLREAILMCTTSKTNHFQIWLTALCALVSKYHSNSAISRNTYFLYIMMDETTRIISHKCHDFVCHKSHSFFALILMIKVWF